MYSLSFIFATAQFFFLSFARALPKSDAAVVLESKIQPGVLISFKQVRQTRIYQLPTDLPVSPIFAKPLLV
jgi:hypothetical protein